MRKTMWRLPMTLAVALCLAAAPAGASKGRTAEATYNFDPTKGGSIWVSDENAALTSSDVVTFETKRSDKMVALSVVDDSAATVTAAVWQEGTSSTIFCDEIASVPVTGGEPLFVQVILDATPAPSAGCASPEVPSTGTVTAAFTRGAMKKKGHGHHHH